MVEELSALDFDQLKNISMCDSKIFVNIFGRWKSVGTHQF